MDAPLIDKKTLDSLTGGDEKKLEKYIGIFSVQLTRQLAQIQQGIDSNDLEIVRLSLHTLKSQFAYMGLPELNKIAQDLEAQAHLLNPVNFPASISHFIEKCKEGEEALKKVIVSTP